MSKAFILGFIVGIALLIVVGVSASRRHQKNPEQERYNAELQDATPVKPGEINSPTPPRWKDPRLHRRPALRKLLNAPDCFFDALSRAAIEDDGSAFSG